MRPLTTIQPYARNDARRTVATYPPRPSGPAEQFRSAAVITQLVSEFVAPIAIGLIADWQLGWLPWGTAIGTVLGLLLGGFRVKAILKKLDQDDQARRIKGERP